MINDQNHVVIIVHVQENMVFGKYPNQGLYNCTCMRNMVLLW